MEAVIVSGASSGIGAALLDRCTRTASHYDISRRGSHPTAQHLAADLSTDAGWDAATDLFTRVIASTETTRVTYIHNAGTLEPLGFAGSVDPVWYRSNVLLNSASGQILGDAFLRAAGASPTPCDLVMIGSGAAHRPMAGWASYGAAKAATAMWTQCAGAEQDLLARGNCVVWIAPGVVATPMQAKIRTADESVFPDVAQFQALHDDGILTTTTDVADAIWSILDGTFVNGAVLDVRDL